MGKYLQEFLGGGCLKRGDNSDKEFLIPKNPVTVVTNVTFLKGGVSLKKEETICSKENLSILDVSMYTDFYEERAAIYEFDAYDVVKSRLEAERLALKDTLVKFIDDQQIQLQPEQVADYLRRLAEAIS